MSSEKPNPSESRRSAYKFNAMTSDEFRRRRQETKVEIRKTKREDSINKRRNLVVGASAHAEGAAAQSANEAASVPASGFEPSTMSDEDFMNSLPDMIQGINSTELPTLLKYAIKFRKALAKEFNAPIQETIDCGVVPRFVQLLSGEIPGMQVVDEESKKTLEDLQFECAWVLTNIASGKSHHTRAVVDVGAVPCFISLMRHPNPEIREQCIWALGNISGDGYQMRNYVIQEGMLDPLLENIEFALEQGNAQISVIRNGAWAISNLCRGQPSPPWDRVQASLPTLFKLMQVADYETIVDACWAMAYMTADSEVLGDVVDCGIVSLLVPMLQPKELAMGKIQSQRSVGSSVESTMISIQVPALRAIGNIVTGNDRETQCVIECGALPLMRELIAHPKTSLAKEACWAISNVTAGTPEQVEAVINANIIPPLINALLYADYKIKKEACWAICNATSHYDSHPDQVKYLVGQGCIKPLCLILDQSQDNRLILVALDGIINILNVGDQEALLDPESHNPYAQFIEEVGGLDSIVSLQDHPETEVYLKSKEVIDKFYEGEEDNDEIDGSFTFDNSPNVPEGGFNF